MITKNIKARQAIKDTFEEYFENAKKKKENLQKELELFEDNLKERAVDFQAIKDISAREEKLKLGIEELTRKENELQNSLTLARTNIQENNKRETHLNDREKDLQNKEIKLKEFSYLLGEEEKQIKLNTLFLDTTENEHKLSLKLREHKIAVKESSLKTLEGSLQEKQILLESAQKEADEKMTDSLNMQSYYVDKSEELKQKQKEFDESVKSYTEEKENLDTMRDRLFSKENDLKERERLIEDVEVKFETFRLEQEGKLKNKEQEVYFIERKCQILKESLEKREQKLREDQTKMLDSRDMLNRSWTELKEKSSKWQTQNETTTE